MDRVPLDDAAFFTLMTDSLPEMQAWDAESEDRRKSDRLKELLDYSNPMWQRPMPSAHGPLRRDMPKSEFQQYMEQYIATMDEIQKVAPEGWEVPALHPAHAIGELLRDALIKLGVGKAAAEATARMPQAAPAPTQWVNPQAEYAAMQTAALQAAQNAENQRQSVGLLQLIEAQNLANSARKRWWK